jgi:6-phosphogluconolactonase
MKSEKGNNIRVFGTIESLNITAAKLLVEIAESFVKNNGRFLLCLSGGNTPKSFYKILSENPYRRLIPWKNTFIFWTDERCVSMDDENNNAHSAYEVLLKKIDMPVANIFPIKVNLTPANAAIDYESTLKVFFGKESPVFDLILLGLGENGHTASLFPNTSVLREKTHWVKEVFAEELNMYRITMTAPLINKARNIFILITGEDKSRIVKTIFSASYEPEKYPIQLIKPLNGEMKWFLDKEAASELSDI